HTVAGLLHHLILAGDHLRHIERMTLDPDPVIAKRVDHLVIMLRGVQQAFGGNTSHIQTGPSQGVILFNDGGFHAELAGSDRGYVAAGTGADDDQVVGHADGGCVGGVPSPFGGRGPLFRLRLRDLFRRDAPWRPSPDGGVPLLSFGDASGSPSDRAGRSRGGRLVRSSRRGGLLDGRDCPPSDVLPSRPSAG